MSILKFTRRRTSLSLESDLYIASSVQKQHWKKSSPPAAPEIKKTDIRALPPEEWTDANVYKHLTTKDTRFAPTLDGIEEILIRKNAGSQVRCRFLNKEQKECRVWLPAVLMVNKYSSLYYEKLVPLQVMTSRLFSEA